MPEDSTPSQPPTLPTQPKIPATQDPERTGAVAAATPAPPLADAATDSALPPVPTTVPDTGYTADGVPTFDGVREKIETRYGTALGSTELAEETNESRAAAQQYEARQKAAEEKLAEIRASMHKAD